MRRTLKQPRVQVKHVARIGLAPGRASQQQTHGAVRDGVLGKVVVDDQHIPALLHKIFAQRAAGVGGDILQRRALARTGVNDDGIVHRAVFFECLRQLHHGARLLTDGYIDADDILPLLVEDRVQRNGSLARLSIADDQLALTAANGKHRVDGKDARLHRAVDRLAVDNARRGTFDRAVTVRLDLAEPIDRYAEGVDGTTQKTVTDRNAGGFIRASDRAAGTDRRLVVKQNAADALFAQILHHAAHAVFKQQYLAVSCVRKTGDLGDPVAHGEHRADLPGKRPGRPFPHRFPEQRNDVCLRADRLMQHFTELLQAGGRGVIVDLLAHDEPEAVRAFLALLPGKGDLRAVFFRQKSTEAIFLLLRRRDPGVQNRLVFRSAAVSFCLRRLGKLLRSLRLFAAFFDRFSQLAQPTVHAPVKQVFPHHQAKTVRIVLALLPGESDLPAVPRAQQLAEAALLLPGRRRGRQKDRLQHIVALTHRCCAPPPLSGTARMLRRCFAAPAFPQPPPRCRRSRSAPSP